MTLRRTHPVQIASVYTWIGFVCAISFMEAWLKFQAPGITIPLGLGIGKLVFNVLNKIEWVFAVAVFICFMINKQNVFRLKNWHFMLVLTILLVQTFWLLPALDVRAVAIINGEVVPPSSLHFYYIIMEVLKVLALFILGYKTFEPHNRTTATYRKQVYL